MNMDRTLASVGKNDKFMAQITADRPSLPAHRNCLQAHAVESAQIGDEHFVVRMLRAGGAEIEAVGVLHQELSPPHHPKARPHLVAEFPLDVIEDLRQV